MRLVWVGVLEAICGFAWIASPIPKVGYVSDAVDVPAKRGGRGDALGELPPLDGAEARVLVDHLSSGHQDEVEGIWDRTAHEEATYPHSASLAGAVGLQ